MANSIDFNLKSYNELETMMENAKIRIEKLHEEIEELSKRKDNCLEEIAIKKYELKRIKPILERYSSTYYDYHDVKLSRGIRVRKNDDSIFIDQVYTPIINYKTKEGLDDWWMNKDGVQYIYEINKVNSDVELRKYLKPILKNDNIVDSSLSYYSTGKSVVLKDIVDDKNLAGLITDKLNYKKIELFAAYLNEENKLFEGDVKNERR